MAEGQPGQDELSYRSGPNQLTDARRHGKARMTRRQAISAGGLSALAIASGVSASLYFADDDQARTRPEQLWRFPISDPLYSELSVSGDTVFVACPTESFALRAADGRQIWSISGNQPDASAPLSDSENAYIIGNQNGTLTAVNRRDGQVSWQFIAGRAAIGGVVLDQSTLYLGLLYLGSGGYGNGEICALSVRDGSVLWRAPSFGSNNSADWPALAANGTLYASGSSDIRALSLSGGHENWLFEPPTGSVSSGLMLADDKILACYGPVGLSGQQCLVVALDADCGDEIWSSPIPGERVVLQVSGKVLYAVGSAARGAVAAIDIESGVPLWTRDLDNLGEYLHVSDRVVIVALSTSFSLDGVARRTEVLALNPRDGRLMWRIAGTGPDLVTSPIGAPDAIFVPFYEHDLRAVYIDTGAIKWQLSERTVSGLAASSSAVFAITADRIRADGQVGSRGHVVAVRA